MARRAGAIGWGGAPQVDMGRVRCAPVGRSSAGNSEEGHVDVRREATVKCYGLAVAMPQGQSWAPPSSSESTVNTGTPFRSLPAVTSPGPDERAAIQRPGGR